MRLAYQKRRRVIEKIVEQTAEDAPDVKAYKETMLEGFGILSSDVQDLDALTCSLTGADCANVEGS